MRIRKINRRHSRPRRIDQVSLLRMTAKSGRKVVVGRLLPQTDVAISRGGEVA